jgi:hypothetical protein
MLSINNHPHNIINHYAKANTNNTPILYSHQLINMINLKITTINNMQKITTSKKRENINTKILKLNPHKSSNQLQQNIKLSQ